MRETDVDQAVGVDANLEVDVDVDVLSDVISSLRTGRPFANREDRVGTWEEGQPSKREAAYAALEDPTKVKEAVQRMVPGLSKMGEGSKQPAEASG